MAERQCHRATGRATAHSAMPGTAMASCAAAACARQCHRAAGRATARTCEQARGGGGRRLHGHISCTPVLVKAQQCTPPTDGTLHAGCLQHVPGTHAIVHGSMRAPANQT
eukprot:10175-Chlamydomonas_euryale.AAC.4